MATTTLVSVDEYLHSTFEHDAEYVEGRIVPRPTPKKPHSRMQGCLVRILYEKAHPLGYEIWTEQRMRTQLDPPRFRVPDLCVTQGEPADDVFIEPPFLCVEILSPDDSAVDVWAKVREYLACGVAYVWIVDPTNGMGEIHSQSAVERVEDGRFHAGEFFIQIEQV